MFIYIYGIVFSLCIALVSANNLTQEERAVVHNNTLEAFAKIVFKNAMESKRAFQQSNTREAIVDNFATTAPRAEFILNADIVDSLSSGVQSAEIYVSTDNQNTWQVGDAQLLGTQGYENTWEGVVQTSGGNTAHAYLRGEINSSSLGYDYGNLVVSSSPHNINGNWPPGDNLYANFGYDEQGDAPSNQDILQVRGTYKGNIAFDSDGEEYTDVERIYLSLDLDGNCCEESEGDGGFFDFGPWFLYGLGIVNPESVDAVAYAIGYGDGGTWGGSSLYPGVLKITGDLATGEIGGFEFLSNNITYSTAGNTLQATTLMNVITNDSQWGSWPNSFNGFIVNAVTVRAALDGLDVDATILDQSDPGLFICNTTSQEGNQVPILSNPSYNEGAQELSINYVDNDGNLPWKKIVEIGDDGGEIFSLDMIPNSHAYDEGVTFSINISDLNLSGTYPVNFIFSDGDQEPTMLSFELDAGGSLCTTGDSNGDGTLNVLDVVLLVNLVLVADSPYDECSDINGDGTINVLDVVLLVNIVLGT